MKERRLTAAVLNRFRQELLRRERSAPTIEKYLHDVRTFAVWLDGREVTPEAVLAWKRELVDQFKPGTVNGKLAAVNALFAFAGWPDCQARSLKVQRRAFRDNARELTKEEFYRLVATAERLGKDRLALLFEAIGSTGVRVSEVKYFTVEAARLGRAEIALKGQNPDDPSPRQALPEAFKIRPETKNRFRRDLSSPEAVNPLIGNRSGPR